ncbi:hypothetical protein CPB85DRAFT_1252480 [Mucidula mucida]|nr:hypothetical protein CPB85DRAFT_1252480 [Mucidula mucida]
MPPRAPTFPRSWTVPLVRFAFSIAFAYSYSFNIRNVEYYWYALWNHVLLDLLPPDRPDLVVAPQFLLWIDPSVRMDEAEDPPQSSDDDSDYSDSDSHSDADDGDDFEEAPALSCRTTAASPEASAQLVDFAIAHLIMTPKDPNSPRTPHPDNTDPFWLIADRRIPVLVEIKKFVTRRTDEFNALAVVMHLMDAKEQLVRGAAHVFAQTDAQEVRVIAGAGPWWTNRTLNRHPDAQSTRLSDEDLKYYLKEGKLNPRTGKVKKILDVETLVEDGAFERWSVPLRLGTVDSNRRLETITKHLHALEKPEEIKKRLTESCCIM